MKVGDKVRTIDVCSGGFKLGTVGEIAEVMLEGTAYEYFKVAFGGNFWFYSSERLELVNPEPKGKCLTDATQELYTALNVLLETAIRVENHLIVHPYQLALAEAIHVAQEAVDKAENGKLEEDPFKSETTQKRAARKMAALGSGYKKGVNTLNLTFSDPICTARTICPNCHTNHEV